MNTLEVVNYALQQVGPAIVLMPIVLVTGFLGVATITNLGFNGDMGLGRAMVLAVALLLTLIALPVLVMMFDRDETDVAWSPEPIADASTS